MRTIVLCLVLSVLGCGGLNPGVLGPEDASAPDVPVVDSPTPQDAPVPVDSGVDVPVLPDVSMMDPDVGILDSGPDVLSVDVQDSATDVPVDVFVDVGYDILDSGSDVLVDSGVDVTSRDAGSDTSVDSGVDVVDVFTPTDSGVVYDSRPVDVDPCSSIVCSLPNATSVCVDGSCITVSCSMGFGNCSGTPSSGCATPLTTNSNCGSCGNMCSTGTVCTNGVCVSVCEPGMTYCSGDCVDMTSDPSNCGGCGSVCVSEPNSEGACISGSCGITCESGFSDCDGSVDNGCETNIRSDHENCGGCGNSCSIYQNCSNFSCVPCGYGGGPACTGSGSTPCTVPSECNGVCGVETTTDADNCGACGHVCTSSPSSNPAACLNSLCYIPCGPGLMACPGSVPHGSSFCSPGGTLVRVPYLCALTCDSGYFNCDNDPGNGCESLTPCG